MIKDKNIMEYTFKLPIGDWSKDSHEKCDYFIITSNKPLIELLTIYNKMNAMFNFSEQCRKYEDNTMQRDFITLINLKGFDSAKYENAKDYFATDSEKLAKLFVDLMMFQDKTLKLTINDIPMLNHWFAMNNGTYLHLPGNGLFS